MQEEGVFGGLEGTQRCGTEESCETCLFSSIDPDIGQGVRARAHESEEGTQDDDRSGRLGKRDALSGDEPEHEEQRAVQSGHLDEVGQTPLGGAARLGQGTYAQVEVV